MTTSTDHARRQEVFRVKSILLDAAWQFDDDGQKITDIVECGTCGRKWDDARISSLTPAPSGRCPFEYAHEPETDTARQQAEAQLNHIRELMEWLDHASECDEYGYSGGNSCEPIPSDISEWTGGITDSPDAYHNTDAATEAIHENALDVEVNYGWIAPNHERNDTPESFRILLCTGGPAVRIVGDLDEYAEPTSARLEYQDWGTPWTRYQTTQIESDEQFEVLLRFAQQFYFGQ